MICFWNCHPRSVSMFLAQCTCCLWLGTGCFPFKMEVLMSWKIGCDCREWQWQSCWFLVILLLLCWLKHWGAWLCGSFWMIAAIVLVRGASFLSCPNLLWVSMWFLASAWWGCLWNPPIMWLKALLAHCKCFFLSFFSGAASDLYVFFWCWAGG